MCLIGRSDAREWFPSRNIATIAVFYALPVIQLVITYQTVLPASLVLRPFGTSPESVVVFQVVNVTGNQDICFYNFLCAHPLGALRWVGLQVSAQVPS